MGVLGGGHGPTSIGLWPRSHFMMTDRGPYPRGQALGCSDPTTNQVSSRWTSPLLPLSLYLPNGDKNTSE